MTVATTIAASPFKGLAAYGDSDLDALFFFGREREIEVISENLLASRLTVLYGPTGVGKSSVLRAGVVRALRAVPFDREVIVHDRWAADPVAALAAEVARSAGIAARASLTETLVDAGAVLDGQLFLVLDQFEEYFVYHGGELAPGTFASELATALTENDVRAHVLLCLREDSLAKLDAFKTRVPGVFSNYLRLAHLDPVAARAAITGPIERWNDLFGGGRPVAVEPALVDAVLAQVTTADLDAKRIETPYLQLVLERLWAVERTRDSAVLRLSTLTELGGAGTIVADHLAHAIDSLTLDERTVAATLFLHLVTPSGTKISQTVADLARYVGVDESAVARVTDKLVRDRVLRSVPGATGEDPRLEIFHDVLAAAVVEWRTRFDAQRAELHARREAELHRRRAIIVAAVSLAALVVVAAVAVFALAQRSQARDRARAARAGELASQALLLESTDPGAALTRALQASRLRPDAQTEEVLRTALLASRLRRILTIGAPVSAVAWPGIGRAAFATQDGQLGIWDVVRDRVIVRTRAPGPVSALRRIGGRDALLVVGPKPVIWNLADGRMTRLGRGSAPTADASPSPNGELVATAGPTGVGLWSTTDGSLVRTIAAPGARLVRFSPDGRTLGVVRHFADGRVTAWLYDAASGARLGRSDRRGATALAFSPDSSLLAVASADGTVALLRARDGRALHVLDDGGGAIRDVVFDHEGDFLATASADGGARVWRVGDGIRWFILNGHTVAVTTVAFAPDDRYLATTSDDGTARIWIMRGSTSGSVASVLAGSRGAVVTAAYSPRGHTLVTGAQDGTVRLWEPRVEQQLRPAARGRGWIDGVHALRAGAVVTIADGEVRAYRDGRISNSFAVERGPSALSAGSVVSANGRTLEVRGLPGGARTAEVTADGTVKAVALTEDGRTLAAATSTAVDVWALPGEQLVDRFAAEPEITAVALSPDGAMIATGDASGVVRLRTSSGKLLHVLRYHRRGITDAAFDPTTGRLVTTSEGSSRNAAVWDVRTGRLVHTLVIHAGTVTAAAFSPDGRWIATAGPSAAGVWFAGTGQVLFLLRGPTTLLTDIAWAPTGSTVVTGEQDGIARSYTCLVCGELPSLQALADARLSAAR